MPKYKVEINGQAFIVDSPNRELSNREAEMYARQQMDAQNNEEDENRTAEEDLLKVTQPPIEQDEDAQIKLDAIEALKMEDQTYDDLKQNQVVLDAAKRFANDRLGYENMEGTDAFDEVIEQVSPSDYISLKSIGF